MILELMKHIGWRERLFKSTRGKILDLLRTKERTVNELAAEVRLTDNAVRAHLANLERDRLVAQSGIKAGVRKPHITYALGPDADNCSRKHTGDWFRFSCRYFLGRLIQEICAPGCALLGEVWRKNICASCAAKRASKELMLRSAFSRSWGAQRLFVKKTGSTSSTAPAVQSPPRQLIIPKHVCSPNRCSPR